MEVRSHAQTGVVSSLVSCCLVLLSSPMVDNPLILVLLNALYESVLLKNVTVRNTEATTDTLELPEKA